MKNLLTLLIFLLVLFVAIAIGAQNPQLVTVNYLIAASAMPLSSALAIALVVGIVLSFIMLSGYLLRLRWKLSRLQKKLDKHESRGK